VGRNRRQQRAREHGREGTATATRRPGGSPGGRTKPASRRSLDQWGGLPVVGAGAVVMIVIALIVWQNVPNAASTEALLGEPVPITSAAHVESAALMDIEPGLPPAGGPHFATWLRTGVYDEPQQDGLVVHALEHGVVWLSYHPDLISTADLEVLRRVGRSHRSDVVVSPRPDNDGMYAVSWGWRMAIESPVDEGLLRRFVETNRDRSPEPFVR